MMNLHFFGLNILPCSLKEGRTISLVDCALALVGQGRPVKAVCSALGVARSHVCLLVARPQD